MVSTFQQTDCGKTHGERRLETGNLKIEEKGERRLEERGDEERGQEERRDRR